MPRINEATDTDLKIIEELKKFSWSVGRITLRSGSMINDFQNSDDYKKPFSHVYYAYSLIVI